jgi:two-component system, OmpR family, sensor histidine kinase MtrB
VSARRTGLRTRITVLFGLGALALSAALAVRAAYLDAAFVRTGLGGEEPDVQAVLQDLNTGEVRRPLVQRDGEFFGTSADPGLTAAIPAELQRLVADGTPAVQRVPLRDSTAIVVGVPLPAVDAGYYEVSPLTELERTLRLLATVLALVALGTTLAGAALGWVISRRVLRPLASVAQTAGTIASGDYTARVAREGDPDLDTLAVSFNRMVDEVAARSASDRRFAADVSHELRSPLQTLSAATSVLDRRRDQLDSRTGQVIGLVCEEVERFESLVTDLLELARSDKPAERRPTDVVALTRALLASRGLPPEVLDLGGEAAILDVDPRRYEQVLANLVDNAARHGGGAVRVGLVVADDRLVLEVDDEGPGVPADERELVFRRFARGRAANARGGTDGTGLGLSLVAQHVQAHLGTVEVLDRPGGGARFRVVLPGAAP